MLKIKNIFNIKNLNKILLLNKQKNYRIRLPFDFNSLSKLS